MIFAEDAVSLAYQSNNKNLIAISLMNREQNYLSIFQPVMIFNKQKNISLLIKICMR